VNPVAVGFGVIWRWVVFYTPLSLVTWLWAGSVFSSGQGGGIAELAFWAGSFGVITAVAAAERRANGRRVISPGGVFIAVVIGQVVGTAAAIAWFTTHGGPRPGDWWIGPACAMLAALVWVHGLAPRRNELPG
jgi:hypothetical protein